MEQKDQSNPSFHQIPLYPECGYDDAEEMDRDMEYMKELYPKAARAIQQEVEEECDKLEYDGSCMFDEYPNREHLGTIVDAIYDRIMDSSPDGFSVQAEQVTPPEQLPPWSPPPFCPPNGRSGLSMRSGQVHPFQLSRPPQPPRPPRPSRPDYGSDGSPDWVKTLISVLLNNEMLHRRRRYRRRKRPSRRY